MRKKHNRLVCLVLAGAMALGLLGCGNSGGNGASSTGSGKKDSLVIATSDEMNDLNVHLYAGNMRGQSLVFEGLVDYDCATGEIKPMLAEKWTISEDGKTYTFNLKKGVKFTDGEVCDAKAVKANFDAVLDNATRHNWMALVPLIEGCKAVDDLTFELNLKEPYFGTLSELALIRPFRMMSPKSFKNGGTKDGVEYLAGTGPYKLDKTVEKEYSTFVANENYWGGVPAIKNLTFKILPAGETTLMAYKKGEVDLLIGTYDAAMIDPDAAIELSKDEKNQMVTSETMATRFLMIGGKKNRTLNDDNLREAVWYAINRKELCDTIFAGFESPATQLFAKNMPYCNIELTAKDYNVEKAKEAIEKAGYIMGSDGFYAKGGKKLTLSITYKSNVATNKTICEYIQANFKAVGIDLTLDPLEKAAWSDKRTSGDYDIILDATWGTPYDPQSTATAIFSDGSYKPAVGEYSFYGELGDQLKKALVETDTAKRQEYITNTLTIFHDKNVFIPISYAKCYLIASKELKGLGFGQGQYDIPCFRYSF